MAEIRIAEAAAWDAAAWTRLREALWPGGLAAHEAEIAAFFRAREAPAASGSLVILAFAADAAVGLAEAALRHDHVNGCDTTPVAFLEGLYVAEDWRRRGIARRLVDHVAGWSRERGCVEFASDAAIGNEASHLLHAALGFVETERVVCYRRMLAP